MSTPTSEEREIAKRLLFSEGFDAMQYPSFVEKIANALALHRQEVIEECAKVADKYAEDTFNDKEWAFGMPAPVGRMDAEDGTPTIPCPECKADKNPITKNRSKEKK